jgi:hypothetical protein
VGVTTDQEATSQVLETYLGVRWKAWRGLEAFGGYRIARYTDVGADIRPNQITWTRDPSSRAINAVVADVIRTSHSVNYEGFYAGVSYKY